MKRFQLALLSVVVGAAAIGLGGRPATAQLSGTVIRLHNEFIDRYKDRATIHGDFFIDKAHKKPNAPSKDGDMHIAGRSPQALLPTVAELMNAKEQQDALDLIKAKEGTGDPVRMTGVWRLWCEHAGTEAQIQGAPLQPFTSTNPPHVFEIHPVTAIGTLDVRDTLHPITGFKTKDAATAFTTYENLRCHMDLAPTTTTITTTMAGYNYVEFVMELREQPREVVDGAMVLAKVRDLEGELLVHKRRMVLVKGSKPYEEIHGQSAGKAFHVLGIPRINLFLVAWRRDHAAQQPDVLDWDLPYEITIVGYYEEFELEEE